MDAGDFEYRGDHLGSSGGIRLDTTILPSLSTHEDRYITITVRPSIGHESALKLELSEIASGEDIVIGYRIVSEVSPGEVVESALFKVVEPPSLAKAIADKLGWKSG